ncbi:hypothetical protein RPALISO_203 [Ruegeria phage RpAliso]|nr:hypothetical protein RPALISO_203 [Ruegeria phage RpAliso]
MRYPKLTHTPAEVFTVMARYRTLAEFKKENLRLYRHGVKLGIEEKMVSFFEREMTDKRVIASIGDCTSMEDFEKIDARAFDAAKADPDLEWKVKNIMASNRTYDIKNPSRTSKERTLFRVGEGMRQHRKKQ